jgi:hypothetical protein
MKIVLLSGLIFLGGLLCADFRMFSGEDWKDWHRVIRFIAGYAIAIAGMILINP